MKIRTSYYLEIEFGNDELAEELRKISEHDPTPLNVSLNDAPLNFLPNGATPLFLRK